MGASINKLADQIQAAVRAVTSQREFLKWLRDEEIDEGLVLLNNERNASPQFWRRNIAVMEATMGLLSRTSSVLKLLARTQLGLQPKILFAFLRTHQPVDLEQDLGKEFYNHLDSHFGV